MRLEPSPSVGIPDEQCLQVAGRTARFACGPHQTASVPPSWMPVLPGSSASLGPWMAKAGDGRGRKLRLWTPAGDLLRECSPHVSTVTDIAWHPSRQQLATTCYGGVSFWQPDRSEAVRQFAWKGSLLALAWSPNGKLLASGDQDSSVHFWFVTDGTDLHMSGYACKVRELTWSADSRFLATGGSVDVVLWDCSKGPSHHDVPSSFNTTVR